MEAKERSYILLEWAVEQSLPDDSKLLSTVHEEARRRWGHLTSRHGISQITKATLGLLRARTASTWRQA